MIDADRCTVATPAAREFRRIFVRFAASQRVICHSKYLQDRSGAARRLRVAHAGELLNRRGLTLQEYHLSNDRGHLRYDRIENFPFSLVQNCQCLRFKFLLAFFFIFSSSD